MSRLAVAASISSRYWRGVLVIDHRLGQRLVELGQRGLGIALVEVVDRAIVAQPTGDDRVLADHFRGRENRVRLGEAAEVRFLQRFVDQRLGAVSGASVEPLLAAAKNSAASA